MSENLITEPLKVNLQKRTLLVLAALTEAGEGAPGSLEVGRENRDTKEGYQTGINAAQNATYPMQDIWKGGMLEED